MEVLELVFSILFSFLVFSNASSIAPSPRPSKIPAALFSPSIAPAPSSPLPSSENVSPSPSPLPHSSENVSSPSIAPSISEFPSLDPAQLKALRSLAVPLDGDDPCGDGVNHGNDDGTIVCDHGNTRHVIALELRYCPVAAAASPSPELSMDSLQPLASTLKTLAFIHCPMRPSEVPPDVLASLQSLTIVSSLDDGNGDGNAVKTDDGNAVNSGGDGGSGDGNVNVNGAVQLTGLWISKFRHLVHLELRDLAGINASGVKIMMNNMSSLESLTIHNTSLKGHLPRIWPSNLTSIDLSSNRISGELPSFFGALQRLESLDVSNNNITSHIPESITRLRSLSKLVMSNNSLWGQLPRSISSMTELTYLDLGGNRLNGSIPAGISELRSLRYVDLRDNQFSGVLPFNSSFVSSLHSLKLDGNPSLCYDESVTLPKLASGIGIARCDQFGNPIVPSVGSDGGKRRHSPSSDSSPINGGDNGDDGGGSGGRGGKVKKVVWALATTLGAIFLFVAILVLISKWCKSNKGY